MRESTRERAAGPASPPRADAGRLAGWDRPVVVALATLIVASAFATARLATYDWDPTGFVYAGDVFVDAERAPPGLLVRKDSVGFDGTGFYRFALDPFTRDKRARGIDLDLPAFRHQRILYPLLAWAASGGGRPAAVGWALIAINVAGLAAIGFLGAHVARALGRPGRWGALFPLYPGFVISLGLDTAEIVSAALSLAGILLLLRRRYPAAAMVLSVGVLARETSLLVAAGAGIAWLAARRRRSDPGVAPAVFVAPAITWAAAQTALWVWWHEVALASGGAVDLAAPFYGLVTAARGWPATDGAQAAYQIVLVVAMAAFAFAAARAASAASAPAFARAGFAVAALLACLYSEAIWLHHWGSLRAFTEAYLLGAAVLLASRVDLRRLTVGAAALSVSLAVNLGAHP